jgi:hypothetical protein
MIAFKPLLRRLHKQPYRPLPPPSGLDRKAANIVYLIVWGAAELSEPLGELIERSEKRKVNSLARWEPKASRSKNERINLIIMRSISAKK